MTTTFDEWLRQLGVASKGPVALPPAVRGEAWEQPLALDGDWTGAALEGSIRSAPDADSVLASFTVAGPTVEDDVSTFAISLTGVETAALPDDGDADGVEQLPFMLRLTPSGGDQELLFGGVFTVLGAV